MTVVEVCLLVALTFFVLVAAGLAYRVRVFQGALKAVGILLGAMTLDNSGSGNVLISPESIEEFEHSHNVTSEMLPTGHVLVRAFRVP